MNPFLARNRIVAALAEGTVLVEGAVRSGALNTARWTANLHRPVLGLPGLRCEKDEAKQKVFLHNDTATLAGGQVSTLPHHNHCVIPSDRRESRHEAQPTVRRTRAQRLTK